MTVNKALIYITKMDYPNKKASSIQITRTVTALAKFIPVILVVRKLNCSKTDLKEQLRSFYGCETSNNLRVLCFKNFMFKPAYFPLLLMWCYIQFHAKNFTFYTRSYGLAKNLIRFRWLHRKNIFFETHKKNGIYKEDPVPNSEYANMRAEKEKSNQDLKLIKWVYEQVDVLFFLHNHSRLKGEKIFILKNSEFLWYGLKQNHFLPFTERSLKFVYCGDISKTRLFDFLIDVVNHTNSDFKIDVYGGIPSDISIREEQIKSLGISKKFNFHGHISHKELGNRLKEYRFGISLMEGMKVVDYIENGVVPIIPEIPSFTGIFDRSEVVFFTPDSVQELLKAINTCTNKDYDNSPLKRVIRKFSINDRAHKIIQHLP